MDLFAFRAVENGLVFVAKSVSDDLYYYNQRLLDVI